MEQFWQMLIGMECVTNKDYKARNIPHPVLRVIQRALARTIFTRGEKVNCANNKDLMLIDYMLRPDSEIQCPYLMTIMIRHWLGLQSQNRAGGTVTCCAYITYIGQQLGLQFTSDGICAGLTSLDTEVLCLAHFIGTRKGTAGHRNRHSWRLPDCNESLLPFEALISFIDNSIWLITAPSTPQACLAPPVANVHMEEVPSSSRHVPDTTTTVVGSHSTDPSFQDMYRLMQDMSIS